MDKDKTNLEGDVGYPADVCKSDDKVIARRLSASVISHPIVTEIPDEVVEGFYEDLLKATYLKYEKEEKDWNKRVLRTIFS